MSDERKRRGGSSATRGSSFVDALDSLRTRRVVLIGGKGGVGKTTISAAAALHFAKQRRTILFTTDPASNLGDLFAETGSQIADGRSQGKTRSQIADGRSQAKRAAAAPDGLLTIEALDAAALYDHFLETNLESFLELGDRGTYLDRDELRRFFELSLPGIDELMAWSRIGELVEQNADAMIVVDTAPTGHTLRMLAAADHFRQLVAALDAMQEKHRQIARQLTRRKVRDAMDVFIDDFDAQARRRRELLTDTERAAFVPVMLSERWVVDQTKSLRDEVRSDGISIPFVILNRAVTVSDCERDREGQRRDEASRAELAPLRVVDAPRSCTPLDTAERIDAWTHGRVSRDRGAARRDGATNQDQNGVPHDRANETLKFARLTFFAGKGGVGKTTCSASVALKLAAANPKKRYVILSVDPAHALRDVFADALPPANLAVEAIDTRAKWQQFRETIGEEIERAVNSITPQGLTIAYDTDAMQKLIEIAPPGADEIFAITRISDLLSDHSIAQIVIDTAPTGHFLRLLDLPRTAGEWVREFMRILLHYREVIPPGSLAEELIRASRALKELDEALRSERASVIVVTRPERVVIAETKRLLDDLVRRGVPVGGVIANYVTPGNDCACDRQMRSFEVTALAALGRPAVTIERRDAPVTAVDDLLHLVPVTR